MDTGLRILLVEDDALDILSLRRALKKVGSINELEAFSSCSEAQTYLQKVILHVDSMKKQLPDIMLVDINMPGMNGIDFVHWVKEQVPELGKIPIVMLTSSKASVDVERSYTAGAAGFFVKPVLFDQYIDTIDIILRYWSRSET